MHALLNRLLAAHGPLERWNRYTTLSAHLRQDGLLWSLKGKPGLLDEVDVTIALRRQWAAHAPFGAPDWRTSVTPRRCVIETARGGIVDALDAPRASFAGHCLESSWSAVQLAYAAGYWAWNCLTLPFALARPGFAFDELPAVRERGETWRRLEVTYPDDVATHCPVQVLYVGPDGHLRRHDYDLDINGGTPLVHYFHDYATVDGIALPHRHLAYVRDGAGCHRPGPVVMSMEASAIRFG